MRTTEGMFNKSILTSPSDYVLEGSKNFEGGVSLLFILGRKIIQTGCFATLMAALIADRGVLVLFY
jgi:hypothetical protein